MKWRDLRTAALIRRHLPSTSLSGERRLSWKINAQGQNIVYDDNAIDDVELRNTGLLLGYRILPSLSPLGLDWL